MRLKISLYFNVFLSKHLSMHKIKECFSSQHHDFKAFNSNILSKKHKTQILQMKTQKRICRISTLKTNIICPLIENCAEERFDSIYVYGIDSTNTKGWRHSNRNYCRSVVFQTKKGKLEMCLECWYQWISSWHRTGLKVFPGEEKLLHNIETSREECCMAANGTESLGLRTGLLTEVAGWTVLYRSIESTHIQSNATKLTGWS